ncbi:MAG TPA: TIGR02679 family protein [Steroidobacteraceae bacterium]
MSVDSIDGERLQKLLGGVELANLRLRLRARYERGTSRDEFTLTDLLGHERRALAGLLGRRTLAAGSMRIRRSELDAALAHAGIAVTLREALEFLDGPLSDRRADRAAREQAWSAALSLTAEPRLAALLTGAAGAALVKRLSGSDPVHAELLLAQAARVLSRLPGHGISRAQLAAEVLGDSHGLDNGRPVATIVLRAGAAETSIDVIEAAGLQDAEESVRERWARLGITVNELALPALCLNLAALDTNIAHRQLQRATPLDRSFGLGLSPGEPVHLTLRSLLRRPLTWHVAHRDVFVCENPNIVAIAADRLGHTCAPLICTDGMPSAAQQTLLAQLAACGAQLRYHGDFDWAGLVIGNFVMREFGAEPWRFGTEDYLSATADHRIALRGDKPVVARWDERLAGAMSERRVVVHEEGVVETLLIDLAANRPWRDGD